MANRYFLIETLPTGETVTLPTRPLYREQEARDFLDNLRKAPVGDWSNRNVQIYLNGAPLS